MKNDNLEFITNEHLRKIKIGSMYDIHIPKQYELDMSKVKTLDDVIKIIKALDITVSENYKHFDEIKDYLK